MIEFLDEALTQVELAALAMPVCLGRPGHGRKGEKLDGAFVVEGGARQTYINPLAVTSSGAGSAQLSAKWRGFEIT